MRDPVDVPTGEGSEESRERGRSKAAMPVRDKASERKRVEGEESSLGGWGEGTEKNQRSEEGVLEPVRKGRGEVGVS